MSKLGFHGDINSRSNVTAVVLRLPRYLRSEYAKEAQNSRYYGSEPDFTQVKFVTTFAWRRVTMKVNAKRGMDALFLDEENDTFPSFILWQYLKKKKSNKTKMLKIRKRISILKLSKLRQDIVRQQKQGRQI